MKRIFTVLTILLVLSFGADAQTTAKQCTAKKANCVPTEACAKKMGMTLEECKAMCTNGKLSSVAATETETKVAAATLTSTKEKKACCSSIEECAKKMGMSIEECKAKCGSSLSQSLTKVAAASLTSEAADTETEATTKKMCSKKSSACCKKKT